MAQTYIIDTAHYFMNVIFPPVSAVKGKNPVPYVCLCDFVYLLVTSLTADVRTQNLVFHIFPLSAHFHTYTFNFPPQFSAQSPPPQVRSCLLTCQVSLRTYYVPLGPPAALHYILPPSYGLPRTCCAFLVPAVSPFTPPSNLLCLEPPVA